MNSLLSYPIAVVLATLTQILLLVGPGLFLASLMQVLAEVVKKNTVRLIGWKGFMYGFGLVGIPLHELGHAAFNILFFHRIQHIRLFQPNDTSGVAGMVQYTYNPNNLYHRIGIFFSAIGPLIIGSIVLYVTAEALLGHTVVSPSSSLVRYALDSRSVASASQLVGEAGDAVVDTLVNIGKSVSWTDWKFYVFLYVVFSVGSWMTLSRKDIEIAGSGFPFIVGLLLTLNLLTLWLGAIAESTFNRVVQFCGSFYGMMIFALLLNVLAAFITTTILKLKGVWLRR